MTHDPTTQAAGRQIRSSPPLGEQLRQAQAKLEPAAASDVAAQVGRLFAHFPARLSRGEADVVARDYIRLLGHYPAVVLSEAVDEALRRCKFRPSIAEIIEVAEPVLWRLRGELRELITPWPAASNMTDATPATRAEALVFFAEIKRNLALAAGKWRAA